MEFADLETPEDILIRKEESEWVYGFLGTLTAAQFRRVVMKADNKSFHFIAAFEGTTVNAVWDS